MTSRTRARFFVYGWTPDYQRRLEALADALHAKVVTQLAYPRCFTRLHQPRHRCTYRRCAASMTYVDNPSFLDHVVWLKARDGSRWWMLTQPYSFNWAEVIDWVELKLRLQWQQLPRSPYSESTFGLLIHGLPKVSASDIDRLMARLAAANEVPEP